MDGASLCASPPGRGCPAHAQKEGASLHWHSVSNQQKIGKNGSKMA
jgi:hypothetical protein